MEIRAGSKAQEIVRGVRATDTREPIQPGDPWHLGSNGKPFTTTLLAILVEQGKLRWGATVAELLPDLVPVMHPRYKDLTIAELASHRSGLAGEGDLPLIMPHYDDKRPLPQQRSAFLANVLAQPPAQPRGTYMYSNRGFMVLGAIAERAASKPFEQLMRDLIFKPLGLRTAAFGSTSRGQPLGHQGGKPLEGRDGDNPAFWTPAGTIRMSLDDWGTWTLDQINGDRGRGKLLTAAGYRYLQSPQILPPGRKTAVALDWGVRQEDYGRILTHTGSNGAWYAIIGIAPDIRSAILIATNSAEDMQGDKAAAAIFNAMSSRWKVQSRPRSGEHPSAH